MTQALEIKAKAVYRRIFENPCVGGSIPPRATKKPKPPSGGFFIMTEYQSSAWEINLQVNHGVAA